MNWLDLDLTYNGASNIDQQDFRRGRVMRDHTNPLDIYGDKEIIERFCFNRAELSGN